MTLPGAREGGCSRFMGDVIQGKTPCASRAVIQFAVSPFFGGRWLGEVKVTRDRKRGVLLGVG